ncbi:uncharacterized protein [Nicotiana sylvestris]|uniref:uncharacterized protein n=1 Tax=Nicotiana sylvestris TaxID=4096 RepID=UPI00388CB148
MKKEHVQPKRKKGSTKAMVAAWGETSDEDSEDEVEEEQALMAIRESDDEQEIINNAKEVLSRECVILKAKCKSLESRDNESDNTNAELKNQVLELDNSVLELRSENLKLKLRTGKKKSNHTYLTLEENLGKMKDELYKKDELIKVPKEDLGKVKHEKDRTCKWNKTSDALSWLQEHRSSNKKGLGYGTQAPKWDSRSKYLTLPENKICTHCGKASHYKNECNAKEKASQKNKVFVQEKNKLPGWATRNLIHPFAYRKVQVKGRSQIWYMDSGCSKHMTGNKDQFLSLEDLKRGNVSFGNGNKDLPGVIFLTSKDEAFDMFIAFVRKTQKQLGNQLTSIRSDHGTEFEDSKFAEFSDENGIDHYFSAPRTPQQNGVVERKNRTLEDMARTMLLFSKLPHSFWAEAEHEDEAIVLVKELTKSPAQVKVASKEGIGDGTGPSNQGNLTGGTNHGEIESNPLEELVHEPIPQQQNMGETSSRNQLVVKPHKEKGKDLLVVQIYVDDIIFGATTDRLSKDFAKLMDSEFEMSMMGEINFFLGLQIKQSPNGTTIHQQKYTKELIKKFKMEESKEIDTPIATTTKLDIDEPGSLVDQKLYRGMIGSLLYLTASRPDIVFSVGLCARFQANPKESNLTTVKRIPRYLKGTTGLCLWYPKGSNFDLVGYADANYVGFLVDRKNTSENRFVLVGPVKDVKGAESSRSGGKKKEKEREGASGDERGNGKEKVLVICGGVEEGGNKSGGSSSGEAAEGLVHLSKQQDEPGSSVEETLADLLKRVGVSYDPKKCKTSTQKAPTASKPTKKSKMSSLKPTVPSVPKGRATRSRVRQSEAELQKALEESKNKKKEKGSKGCGEF